MYQCILEVPTHRKGLHPITTLIERELGVHLPKTGILNVFITHTSASLLIQENADPTAREDLEEFLERTAPEGQGWHRHTLEGPDDTTSHLKSAITQTSLLVPIREGRLGLGTWQGIYLWEHRKSPHRRRLILTLLP